MLHQTRDQLLLIVNGVAASLLRRCTEVAEAWVNLVLSQSESRYSSYIEAMLADAREQIHRCRQENSPEYKVLLHSAWLGLSLVGGVFELTKDSFVNAASLLFYGAEQVLILGVSSGAAIGSRNVRMGTTLFSLLHQATGSAGSQRRWAMVNLSPSGRIMAWGEAAEEIFGFRESEALGTRAECIHIPRRGSDGQDLTNFVENLCRTPSDYLLNVNENRACNGDRFWVFWINIPVHGYAGELVEVLSLGIPIDDPLIMNVLLRQWRRCQRFFWTIQPPALSE